MNRPGERRADEIATPDRPAFDGPRFRGYRGPIDVPGMTALNQATREAYRIEDPRLYEECGLRVASSAMLWRKRMDARARREEPGG